MQLVDTHCHIQSIGSDSQDHTAEMWRKEGLSLDGVIADAAAKDVTKLICVGCDLADSRLAISVAENIAGCFAAVGIHPHEAGHHTEQAKLKDELGGFLKADKLVGIGECGLDYFYNHSVPADQQAVLRWQLDLAAAHDLPVIFHVRSAFDDFWPIFDSYGTKLRGVLHSFTDSRVNLLAALRRGLYIGVNGIATFAKDPVQLSVYKDIPSSSLLLETDSPYLTPVPFRGKVNKPEQILTIAEFLADLRHEEVEELAGTTTANAHLLFGV